MKVYLRNCKGQQTIRELKMSQIVRIWLYQIAHVRKEERCIIKILF